MIIDAPKLSDIPALRAIWREAFGDTDAFLDVFFSTAFSPERSRCVSEDGGIVAALYWFDCEYGGGRVAYLYAIATKKEYRGRGFSSAMIRKTHGELKALGYVGAMLVPGDKGLFDFYGRLGYKTATYVTEMTVSASDEPCDLRQIDADEYAKKRQTLLPPEGVVQEKENLTFLEGQAKLYSGEGFLLAATCDGGILRGIELLGDAEKAPSVTRALGCTSGKFRMPGKDIPFSMYLPLSDEDGGMPTYFGLAFD